MKRLLFSTLASLLLITSVSFANDTDPTPALKDKVLALAKQVEPKVIEWRHWVHENAENSKQLTISLII